MYPAQTSLIPVQVALARFLESQGWRATFSNYPFWYLGTTPFRYLTGPILPFVLALLHRSLPNLSLFEIMFGLVGIAWVIGGIGVYFLVRSLANSFTSEESLRATVRGVLAAIFYLFGPIVPFLFRFSDGLYLIAFSFLPYILVLYSRFLKGWSRKTAISLTLGITFLLLLDLSIVPTMILGMAAIFLAQTRWKKAEEKLKKSLVLGAWCLVLVTFWYTPGYWLISLTGPSLAGKGRLGVIFQLSKLLPTALAFSLAIFSVKFFKKRHLLRDFCFYWLFIFGFLTLMRFIADPDFWLDWLSYAVELQIGLALLGGLLLSRMSDMRIQANIKRIYANVRIGILVGVIGVSWLFLTNKYAIRTLQKDITETIEYRISRQLSEIAKPGEKVFISGTTAFWLNAFFDISQVRGGVDQASVDPDWRKAVWEVREGTESEKSVKWLKDLGVSYLVVHTEESEEFYHDFSYPEKFEGATGLEKVYDEAGDRIYRVLD